MSARGVETPANEVVIVSGAVERDLGLREGLVKHLAPWVRKGEFEVWHEERVAPGEPLARLRERAGQAEVIVALLSEDLLADERRWALIESALDRGAHVVPVVGRACGWMVTALGERAALPRSGLSAATFTDAGEAWNEVGEAIARWFEERGASAAARQRGRASSGQAARTTADETGASAPDARPPNNLPPLGLFVGRREELAAVHARLTGGRVAGITQRASVLGLGGVGKTSLALAYAYARADEYPGGIFWMRAQGDPVSALLAFSGELRAIAPPEVAAVLGDPAAARPLLERALDIDETTLGPHHPSVAIDLLNLASVLGDLGDRAAARPLLERALAITVDRLGPDHPRTRVIRRNLETLEPPKGDG